MRIDMVWSFLGENADWIFPLLVTIIFAVVEAKSSKRQEKLTAQEVGISLMEKRMEVFFQEENVLENIIEYCKPSQNDISDLCHNHMKCRFLFEKEITTHMEAVLQLVEKVSDYQKPKLPDGEGGFFSDCHDYEEEEFSQEASALLGEALGLYGKYIDYSNIGIIHSEN